MNIPNIHTNIYTPIYTHQYTHTNIYPPANMRAKGTISKHGEHFEQKMREIAVLFADVKIMLYLCGGLRN